MDEALRGRENELERGSVARKGRGQPNSQEAMNLVSVTAPSSHAAAEPCVLLRAVKREAHSQRLRPEALQRLPCHQRHEHAAAMLVRKDVTRLISGDHGQGLYV